MRLFDLCFNSIFELGNYENVKPILPAIVVAALDRRAASRKQFNQLFEEKLHVHIPSKYLRYYENGEIDADETLKGAVAEVNPRKIFKMMIATDSRKYIDEVWEMIPKRVQLDMTTETKFKVIRNAALHRVFNNPNGSFMQPETAFRQCVRDGWIDAAITAFKPLRIQEKSCHLSRAWFTYFFNKQQLPDSRLLLHLIKAKDFEMDRSSIDLSFFFMGISFEQLVESRTVQPVPEEFRIPEIESWVDSFLASPIRDPPLSINDITV